MRELIAPGRNFVDEVCEIMELTSMKIRSVRISADVRSAVTVEIEHLATDEQGQKILGLLAEYKLVNKHIA